MKLQQLGPYRIVKQIGRGGMGAVYEAISDESGPDAGKRVAIKSLSPQLALAEGFRERFEAEIESLKKLKHEGIVRLYGYGEQDGVLFYSMELVDGPSLEEELNNGRRFDWRETLQIGIQICRALKHAHDHGVVHRDIKPANLMLTSESRIKIADFGIARLFGGTQLTTAGGVLGTADYMSPEQADGRAVTEKCDQYSLGGVMYALLAGRPPFKAKTMPEMLQLQRFAEPEPVRRYAVDTPDQLDRLILQLLAKSPDERFPNVLVLSRHMEAMEKALSRPVKPLVEGDDETTADFAQPSSEATAANNEQATRALDAPLILPKETNAGTDHIDLYDAPTLDQPTESEPLVRRSTLANEPSSSPSDTGTAQTVSHFTTVDEDARRQLEQSQSSRLALVGQLGGLIAALGLLAWGGWHLMKPPSADELFANIQAAIDEQEIGELPRDAIRSVDSQVESFFSRFPDDPRIEKLEPIREQLEFHGYERQARTRAKFRGPDGLRPMEQVYFEAVATAEKNPGQGLSMLRALIVLYDPQNKITDFESAKSSTEAFEPFGDPRLIVVARQRIELLEQQTDETSTTHLPALRERLRDAARLRQTNPAQARLMYQAIVRLYGDKPWARDAVNQARLAIANE